MGTDWRKLLLVLPAVLLLAACNENEGREDAAAGGTPGLAVSGEQESAPAAGNPCTGEPGDAPATESAPASAAGDTDQQLERHWQEEVIEFSEPVSFNLELRSAEFNPAEGADMSILGFEASCRLGRQDWIYKDIVLDSLDSTDSAILELDICSVELMPLLQNPVVTGRTPTGGATLRLDGGLRFVVYDTEGNVMGSFNVNEEGELEEAETGELYSWRVAQTDDMMRPAEYLFYRTPGRGDPIHYEFAVAYRSGTVARRVVEDPLGNQVTYLFPNGTVEILPPEPPERREPGEFRRN